MYGVGDCAEMVDGSVRWYWVANSEAHLPLFDQYWLSDKFAGHVSLLIYRLSRIYSERSIPAYDIIT